MHIKITELLKKVAKTPYPTPKQLIDWRSAVRRYTESPEEFGEAWELVREEMKE